MSIICPTVTAYDIDTFNDQLSLVSGFAERIHIDLMDGELSPTKSPEISQLWLPEGLEVDIHAMYKRPDSILEQLIALKPNLIIIHAESDADIPLLASKLRVHNIKTGLAILPQTEVADIYSLLPHVQHALIFGGHLGYHGGTADLSQLHKATELKKMSRHIEIGWDGGANEQNVFEIAQKGVDVINVGSAIHKAENQKKAFEQLVSLV